MTINEAIQILVNYNSEEELPDGDYERLWKALRLGVHALRRIRQIRKGLSLTAHDDLPGETKKPTLTHIKEKNNEH